MVRPVYEYTPLLSDQELDALYARWDRLLAHPALVPIPKRVVPPALTLCAGPFTARAVEILAQ